MSPGCRSLADSFCINVANQQPDIYTGIIPTLQFCRIGRCKEWEAFYNQVAYKTYMGLFGWLCVEGSLFARVCLCVCVCVCSVQCFYTGIIPTLRFCRIGRCKE